MKHSTYTRTDLCWLGGLVLGLIILFYAPTFAIYTSYAQDDDLAWILSPLVPPQFHQPFSQNPTDWQRLDYAYGPLYASTTFPDYRPVARLYYATLMRVFGDSLMAFRLVHLFVYCIGSLLVFALFHLIARDFLIAAVATVLFAVDPLRKAYLLVIGTQGVVLIFYVSAVCLYIMTRLSAPGRARMALMLGAFVSGAFALFDYELAFSLPLMILFVEFFFGAVLKRWTVRVAETLPFWLLACLYALARTIQVGLTARVNLSGFADFVYAGIQVITRVVMLFIPNFFELRRAVRNVVFGRLSGQTIVSLNPIFFLILLAVVVGLLLIVIYRLSRMEKVKAFFTRDEGRMTLLGGGWSLIAMFPVVSYSFPATRHLLLSAIGASLIKAVGVVVVSRYLSRISRFTLSQASCLVMVPLLLYDFAVLWPHLQQFRLCATISERLLRETQQAIEGLGENGRSITVYHLNALGGIGAETQCRRMPMVYQQKILRQRLKRDDIAITIPYELVHSNVEEYRRATYPEIAFMNRDTILVTNPDTEMRSQWIELGPLDPRFLKQGLRLTNGRYYTLEVLEVDRLRNNPLKFLIRFTHRENEQALFLMYERGHLRVLSPQ